MDFLTSVAGTFRWDNSNSLGISIVTGKIDDLLSWAGIFRCVDVMSTGLIIKIGKMDCLTSILPAKANELEEEDKLLDELLELELLDEQELDE